MVAIQISLEYLRLAVEQEAFILKVAANTQAQVVLEVELLVESTAATLNMVVILI
jgi:hypothetical protein